MILTPLIQEGKVKEAKRAARVDSKHFLGFKSYSGFLTVNETYNSNLFFWYFPVLNKPVNASPWIIWLQGGPGASSMTGLFDEMGPFTVINETLKRKYKTYLRIIYIKLNKLITILDSSSSSASTRPSL